MRSDRGSSSVDRKALNSCSTESFQGVGDMGMNFRVLSVVTLLATLSFHLSALTTTGHQPASHDDSKLELDISSLKQQAREGDAKAQYKLGWSYMTGSGVTKDYEEALHWYISAAKQGSADAEFVLGYMYEQGLGVKKDYGQAFLYYSSAARQGHPTAQNNL